MKDKNLRILLITFVLLIFTSYPMVKAFDFTEFFKGLTQALWKGVTQLGLISQSSSSCGKVFTNMDLCKKKCTGTCGQDIHQWYYICESNKVAYPSLSDCKASCGLTCKKIEEKKVFYKCYCSGTSGSSKGSSCCCCNDNYNTCSWYKTTSPEDCFTVCGRYGLWNCESASSGNGMCRYNQCIGEKSKQKCVDSDGGKEPAIGGWCVDSSGTHYDSCVDGGKKVREWFCSEGKCEHVDMECSSSNCVSGACSSASTTTTTQTGKTGKKKCCCKYEINGDIREETIEGSYNDCEEACKITFGRSNYISSRDGACESKPIKCCCSCPVGRDYWQTTKTGEMGKGCSEICKDYGCSFIRYGECEATTTTTTSSTTTSTSTTTTTSITTTTTSTTTVPSGEKEKITPEKCFKEGKPFFIATNTNQYGSSEVEYGCSDSPGCVINGKFVETGIVKDFPQFLCKIYFYEPMSNGVTKVPGSIVRCSRNGDMFKGADGGLYGGLYVCKCSLDGCKWEEKSPECFGKINKLQAYYIKTKDGWTRLIINYDLFSKGCKCKSGTCKIAFSAGIEGLKTPITIKTFDCSESGTNVKGKYNESFSGISGDTLATFTLYKTCGDKNPITLAKIDYKIKFVGTKDPCSEITDEEKCKNIACCEWRESSGLKACVPTTNDKQCTTKDGKPGICKAGSCIPHYTFNSEGFSTVISQKMKPGWNLVGKISGKLKVSSSCNIYPKIFHWNGQSWDVLDAREDELDPAKGYWIYVYPGSSCEIKQEITGQKEIELEKGWNQVANMDLKADKCKITKIFAYDNGWKQLSYSDFAMSDYTAAFVKCE